jgi:hypothetical protein
MSSLVDRAKIVRKASATVSWFLLGTVARRFLSTRLQPLDANNPVAWQGFRVDEAHRHWAFRPTATCPPVAAGREEIGHLKATS